MRRGGFGLRECRGLHGPAGQGLFHAFECRIRGSSARLVPRDAGMRGGGGVGFVLRYTRLSLPLALSGVKYTSTVGVG